MDEVPLEGANFIILSKWNEITFILASIISILNKNKNIIFLDFPRFGRHIQTHTYVSQAQIQIVEACSLPSLDF